MSAGRPRAEADLSSFRALLSARLRGRRAWVPIAFVLVLTGVVAAASPSLVGGLLGHGVAALAHANSAFLWMAGGGFLLSLIASACTWRTTLEACGARIGTRDACARYGVGSVVNTFTPMRLGDAVRIVLFSRTLPQERGRALTTGGGFATIGLARAIVQAALIVIATLLGALPLWPVAVLAGIASCGMLVAFLGRDRRWLRQRQIGRLLDASRALTRAPGRAVSLLGWTTTAAAARVIAATAVAAALGVPWSLGTGLIITAALDLAATVPLTPGNVGIASGAVTLALQARGAPLPTSIAVGLAFHAVETLVGLAFGAAGILELAQYPSPGARRWTLGLAASASALLVAVGLGAAVVPGVA